MHNTRLYRLATVDGLTGLYVRRFFERRYAEEAARCRRSALAMSLLLVDLDDFKSVNDRFGHPVGDDVLRWMAAMLRQALRLADVPCRYGGDEFVILLPDTEASDAKMVAERLQRAIAEHVFEHNGERIQCTVSIGIAGVRCKQGEAVPDLMAAADHALYRSKTTEGKGLVVMAEVEQGDAKST